MKNVSWTCWMTGSANMEDLLYDLVSRMPYHIPSQQQMFLQETVIGFHKPEPWSYIEARLINNKVLNDYKKIDSFWKKIIRLTGGSQWAKNLTNQKKDEFVKRMEGMLYITNQQVFLRVSSTICVEPITKLPGWKN